MISVFCYKRRRAGPYGPASMKKKKFIYMMKKLSLYLLINIPVKCDGTVRNR